MTPRTNKRWWLVALVLSLAPLAHGDDDPQEALRDIGAVLGWRLRPETLEEYCRAADPDGVAARRKALATWLEKNVALIRQVDSRIAEVVQVLFKGQKSADPVRDIRSQVERLLLENLSVSVCVADRDPASTSWTSNGLPHVAQSLAALYDWQIRHTPR